MIIEYNKLSSATNGYNFFHYQNTFDFHFILFTPFGWRQSSAVNLESKPYPWYLVQYEPDEHKCIRQIAPKELLMWNMETSFYDSIRKQERAPKEHVILYNTNGDACCTYIIQYAKSWDEVVMQQTKLHTFVVTHFGNAYNVTKANIHEYGEWVLLSYFADFTKKDLCGGYTGISYGVYHRSKIVFTHDEATATMVPGIYDLGFLHKAHIIEFSNKVDDLIKYIKLMRSVNLSWVQVLQRMRDRCLSSLLIVVDFIDIFRKNIHKETENLNKLQKMMDNHKRNLLLRIIETKSRLLLQEKLGNLLLASTPINLISYTYQGESTSQQLRERMHRNMNYLDYYLAKHVHHLYDNSS